MNACGGGWSENSRRGIPCTRQAPVVQGNAKPVHPKRPVKIGLENRRGPGGAEWFTEKTEAHEDRSKEACEKVSNCREARVVARRLPAPPRLGGHRGGAERPKPVSCLCAAKPPPIYGVVFQESQVRANLDPDPLEQRTVREARISSLSL